MKDLNGADVPSRGRASRRVSFHVERGVNVARSMSHVVIVVTAYPLQVFHRSGAEVFAPQMFCGRTYVLQGVGCRHVVKQMRV